MYVYIYTFNKEEEEGNRIIKRGRRKELHLDRKSTPIAS
jgi:hypothetical protein